MTTTEAPPQVPDRVDPTLPAERREIPSWAWGTFGFILVLVIWQVVALTVLSKGHAVPTPTAILSQFHKDGWSTYKNNIHTTVVEAGKGWLWGNAAAVILAITFVMIPFLEKAGLKLAVAVYCLPVVAIGPVMAILYSGDTPKVILAAISVFFTTLISMLVGLHSADRTSLDLLRAYGGGSFTELRKVRLKVCLPSLFAGLRIAAPAALLGAVIGEYIGGENGLGVAMINSQQSLEIARTWGIALTIAALAGIGYGLTALAEYLLVPWARRSAR